MSEDDEAIKRAASLGPPTLAEAVLLPIFTEWVAEKPKRLDRVLARARDERENAKVIALHGATNDPAWGAVFRQALVRLESVAAMIRSGLPTQKSRKPKKK